MNDVETFIAAQRQRSGASYNLDGRQLSHEQIVKAKLEVGLIEVPDILAKFYVGAMKEPEWTQAEPRYRDQVMIYIQNRASREALTEIANEEHIEKYPREWSLFQKNHDNHPITLTSLPKANPCVLAAFEDLGIRSVDDVLTANLPAHLECYRDYAKRIKAVHDEANGIKKKLGRPRKEAA